jgi:hypothetical protein
LFDAAYFLLSNSENQLQDKRIVNTEYVVKSASDNDFKAACYYNLGNIYRSKFKNYIAIGNYLQARKINPKYLNKDYWWREIAGLFLALVTLSGARMLT